MECRKCRPFQEVAVFPAYGNGPERESRRMSEEWSDVKDESRSEVFF
jgi:hypothetical protein